MDTIERILVLVLVLLIIIGRTERTRRWWLALLLHTHTNSDPFEFKRREKSLSLFGRRDFKRETKFKPEKKNESCSNARALSLSLSLLPSRNQWKTRFSKKRPNRRTRHHKSAALRKNTKGTMHHRSSRLKRETKKKSNELFKNTNAQLQRSSFLQRLSVPRSTSTRASRWGSGPARTGRRLCRCWQPCANSSLLVASSLLLPVLMGRP